MVLRISPITGSDPSLQKWCGPWLMGFSNMEDK